MIQALFLLPRIVGATMSVAAAVTEVRALVKDARTLAAARRAALEAARAFRPQPAPDYDDNAHDVLERVYRGDAPGLDNATWEASTATGPVPTLPPAGLDPAGARLEGDALEPTGGTVTVYATGRRSAAGDLEHATLEPAAGGPKAGRE